MSPNGAPHDPVTQVRFAPGYPVFLRAARVYAAGTALLLLPALLVATLNARFELFLLAPLGLIVVLVGVFQACRGFRRLARELPSEQATEVRSSATIAAFRDLLRRRRN